MFSHEEIHLIYIYIYIYRERERERVVHVLSIISTETC